VVPTRPWRVARCSQQSEKEKQMAIADLHDLAEKLHNIDEERSLNAVENESVKTLRRLAIDLVRHVDYLEKRIAALEGRPIEDARE
jgi:hypothetical protein